MLIILVLLPKLMLCSYKSTTSYLLSLFFYAVCSFIYSYIRKIPFCFFVLSSIKYVINSEYTQAYKKILQKKSKGLYLKAIMDQLDLLKKTVIFQGNIKRKRFWLNNQKQLLNNGKLQENQKLGRWCWENTYQHFIQ